MSWARFDDQYPDHPKIVKVGPLGMALHTAAICYCARYLTDGFVPSAMMPRLVSFDGISVTRNGVTNAVTNEDVTNELVEVGLLEVVEGGFQVHDYAQYNPSSEQVKAEKAENARRQAVWRERNRGENGKFVSNGVSNSVSNASYNTAPSPSPSLLTTTTTAEPSEEEKLEDLPDDPLEPSEEFAEMCKIYENIGGLSPKISDELQDILEDYGLQWFDAAVKEAVMNNKRNLKYILAILERWKVEGFQSPMKKPTPAGRPGGTRYQQQKPEQLNQIPKGYTPIT